jgi:hypothetical protein
MRLGQFTQKLKRSHFILWLALKHHITHTGNPLTFKNHHYQKEILAQPKPNEVYIKSTQNGITEITLLKAIGWASKGLKIFYVLPTGDLVGRFVKNRLDKTVSNTPYYRGLDMVTRKQDGPKRSDSMSLKDIGKGTIAFVGSNSTAGFSEFPADVVIIDELDECNIDNLNMADERLSHSDYRWRIRISNPTFKGKGIDALYNRTNKKEWFIKCECGEAIRLDWFKHIVRKIDDGRYVIRDKDWTWDAGRDIFPVCHKCGRLVDRMSDGWWDATGTGRITGRRITKLFSGTVPLVETLDRFILGQKDPAMLQRFYNADLGEAYTADGSKVTEEMIRKCIGEYQEGPLAEGLTIAGVDVGKYYNYVIAKVTASGLKVLKVGKERDTDQLVSKLREYNVKAGVIDAMPETREARKIAGKFKMMFVCYYGGNKKDITDIVNRTVTVQRTPALDAVKEAILTNAITYPKNIHGHREFMDQMTASVRVYNPDKRTGGHTGAYEWVEGDLPDHYFHAMCYCLVARRLIVLMS